MGGQDSNLGRGDEAGVPGGVKQEPASIDAHRVGGSPVQHTSHTQTPAILASSNNHISPLTSISTLSSDDTTADLYTPTAHIANTSSTPRKRSRPRAKPMKAEKHDTDYGSLGESGSGKQTNATKATTTKKAKAKKIPRAYAAPEVYAYLPDLPDHLREGLDGEQE